MYILAETEGYPGFSPDYGEKEYLVLGDAAGSGQGSADPGGTAVLVNREELTEFSFYKIWRNATGSDLTWQKPITVTLNAYREGAPGTDVLADATYTLSPDALPQGWTASQNAAGTKTTFTLAGLPAADPDGVPLVYYIVEEQADGCAEPLVVTSSGGAVTDSGQKVRKGQGIINVPEDAVRLPSTGGSGTRPFILAGLMAVICAGAALVLRRRERG